MLNNIIKTLAKEIKVIDSWNNFEGITQPGIAYIPISYIRTTTKELLDILNELTKEQSNGIAKDDPKKFVDWCKSKGYGCYDWRMLLEQYEKEIGQND